MTDPNLAGLQGTEPSKAKQPVGKIRKFFSWFSKLFFGGHVFLFWDELKDDLDKRSETFKAACEQMQKLGRANDFQLAATDLFVEKAQIHLTIRARLYTTAGIALGLLCFLVIFFSIWLVWNIHIPEFIKELKDKVGFPEGIFWQVVVLSTLRAAGIAGFAGAAVYFSASLSRAFFHEATALYNRRHSLRFGRMFIYLKYGETLVERSTIRNLFDLENSSKAGDKNKSIASVQSEALAYLLHRDVRVKDLEQAFGWNLQVNSAFKDIKPETMSASIYSRTLDTLGRLIDRLAKFKDKPDPAAD